MAEQSLPWVGLGLLFLLCLPIRFLQKLVLEVSVWGLRLGMIALLAGGAYLWFSPGDLPAFVAVLLNDFPGLLSKLPPMGSAAFALTAACYIVALFVPVLAGLDVARRRCRDYPAVVTEAAEAEPAPRTKRVRREEPAPEPEPAPVPAAPAPAPEVFADAVEVVEEEIPTGVPIMRPIERRDAASTIASAARPNRPAE
jgi:hypothetical protein